MDIGAHCAVGQCHQQDFLPFTCDCCGSVFCLEHRSYEAHECPNAGVKDRRVLHCPLCQQSVPWTSDQDANEVWDAHVRSGNCESKATTGRTTQGTKKPKKARCAADKCREILVTANKYHCPKCSKDVCLRHRFETDHACVPTSRNAPGRRGGGNNPVAAAAQARMAANKAYNGAKSTVTSFMQTAREASTSVEGNEVCPICSQRFKDVGALVEHASSAHPDGSSNRPANATETCPQCRQSFADVATLISHVESAHSSTSRRASTSRDDSCSVM